MKNVLNASFALVFLLSYLFCAHAGAWEFPKGPELSITPGKLCDRPTKTRYPEKIPYCDRDVNYQTKEIIIHEYDQKFGYDIVIMKRSEFKIDHLIPLCMGGSNDMSNLWPQHRSIYQVTDPIEPILCEKMALGVMKQKEAVELIIEAKTKLDQVPLILEQINRK